MKKIIMFSAAIFACALAFAQKDPFAGFYKGTLEAPRLGYPFKGDPTVYAEVFPDSDGYRLKFTSAIFARGEPYGVARGLKAGGGKIELSGSGSGEKFSNFKGAILPGSIDAEVDYMGKKGKLKLSRLNYVSPTMSMPAPAGAETLFDGKSLAAFNGLARNDIVEPSWILPGDGTVVAPERKPGKPFVNLITKKKYGAVKMHIEFMFPCVYGKVRCERSNSGIIFAKIYEIQLMDSFGSGGYWDETGAVYRQIAPYANASLEPGAWQTLDIEFTPAKYEGRALAAYPKFTVYLNGVLVQRDSPVLYPTALHPAEGAKFDKLAHPLTGEIIIQNHAAPLKFRNIWVVAQ